MWNIPFMSLIETQRAQGVALLTSAHVSHRMSLEKWALGHSLPGNCACYMIIVNYHMTVIAGTTGIPKPNTRPERTIWASKTRRSSCGILVGVILWLLRPPILLKMHPSLLSLQIFVSTFFLKQRFHIGHLSHQNSLDLLYLLGSGWASAQRLDFQCIPIVLGYLGTRVWLFLFP